MKNKSKKDNQSKKILLTASEYLSSKGYADTSMRDIASASKVALSQLNYHFKNKEGLFLEVISFTIQKYLQDIEDNITFEGPPKEKMVNLITCFRKMLDNNPKSFRLLYDFSSMALWHPEFKETLKKLFQDMSDKIEKNIIQDDRLKSKLRKYKSRDLSRMLTGAMFGIAIQVLLEPTEKKLPDALNAIELIFDK